jgi:excisionase family DNA binding protein
MKQNLGPAQDYEADGVLTLEEFCRCYRVGRTTVYEEINAGRLTARKRGSRTLIARDEARRWFRGLPPIELRRAKSA